MWSTPVGLDVRKQYTLPVAWKVRPAHANGSWRPRLRKLAEPARWQGPHRLARGRPCRSRAAVARWLYAARVRCGWHPCLRINVAVKVRPRGTEEVDWLNRWVPQAGTRW